jgi:DNA-binding SARP family transcriptional activator
VRFRRLLKSAQQEGLGDQERSTLLQQALHMWRGDALGGMHSDWAARARETLRQLHHEALSQWADAEIRLERPGAVLAELRAALLTDPLSEQLCERLMLALYMEGRSVHALEYYQSMLPVDLPDFTGRERELDVVQRTLTRPTASQPPAVLLVGG